VKNFITTIILLFIVVVLAIFVVGNWRGVVTHAGAGNNLERDLHTWNERDKVAHPLLYVKHLRSCIEIRREELLRIIKQYDDRNNKHEFELRKFKGELSELSSFLTEAKNIYRKGCGSVEIGGITYSEVDFLRISVEKDKRCKEVGLAIETYTAKLLKNGKIGKNFAEQALEKLLREDRRLKILADDLAVSQSNDKVLDLIRELDDISSDVDALPLDRIRKEIQFGETESERITREGEALFDAKDN